MIPVRSEVYEEPHVKGDHVIPSKMEHIDHDIHQLPKEIWKHDFHGHDPSHHYDSGFEDLE